MPVFDLPDLSSLGIQSFQPGVPEAQQPIPSVAANIAPTLDPAILGYLGATPEPVAPTEPATIEPLQPDFQVTPKVEATYGKQNAKANATHTKQQVAAIQQARAQSQQMPTLADTVNEQQAATDAALAANDAATQVAMQRAQDEAAVHQQADKELRANQAELDAWQQKSDQIRADKQASADAAMKAVDSYKVDHNRYWKDASTAKQVGWFVSMALAGLGEALQGRSGPNPVIGMLEQTIDKDVRAQLMRRDELKDALGNAKGSVDEWDRFSANKEARILGKRAQAKELVAQQLLVAASKHGSAEAQANGARAAAELRKGAAKDLQSAVDMAHGHDVQDQQLAISRKQVAISGGHLALDRAKFEHSKQVDAAELELKAQQLAGKGDKKDAELLQKFGVAGVTNKDGTPFIAQGTPEGVEKLRDKVAATRTLVRLMDEARRIRSGWTSDTARSKEWQELKANWAAAQGVAKDVLGLGALSGPDMELVNRFIGSDDPTAWRDPEAGISKARKNVINLTRDALGAHGDGAIFDIPDIIGNGGPKEQPGDAELKSVLGQRKGETAEPRFGASPAESYFTERGNADVARSHRVMDAWADGLKSADPKVRADAFERLRGVAEGAQSPAIKQYAQQLLDSVATNAANEAVR